jgi:hypothetical protein
VQILYWDLLDELDKKISEVITLLCEGNNTRKLLLAAMTWE